MQNSKLSDIVKTLLTLTEHEVTVKFPSTQLQCLENQWTNSFHEGLLGNCMSNSEPTIALNRPYYLFLLSFSVLFLKKKERVAHSSSYHSMVLSVLLGDLNLEVGAAFCCTSRIIPLWLKVHRAYPFSRLRKVKLLLNITAFQKTLRFWDLYFLCLDVNCVILVSI